MKATGIVRRIDDLGRVVIPKEIRRTMRIREGDPLEIYTSRDGEVIFKKYSLMGGLDDFAAQLCETMSRSTGAICAVTDRDSVIAVAGGAKRELLGKTITDDAGKVYEGLGLADFTVVQNKKRFVEDVYGHTDLYEDAVVGFVNRCSVITGVETPLLTSMDMGHGNEGPCGPEGYHKGSVFASQLTGPILVKNPALLKVMVQAIYYHRGETCPEIPVDQYMAEGWAITAEQLKARCTK